MPDPSKMVFVGALDVTDGESVVLNVPPNAYVAAVHEAITRANAERAEAAKKESEALATLFHLPDLTKAGLS